jgi:hypothetical protein
MNPRVKTFTTFLLLASCVTPFAIGPQYSSLRDWVEKRSSSNQTPPSDRVFVNFLWKDSAIVFYHKGMTIQEVIGKTQFREQPLRISVFRAGHKPPGEPVYDEISGKPDRAHFAIEPLDVLWLEEPTTGRN